MSNRSEALWAAIESSDIGDNSTIVINRAKAFESYLNEDDLKTEDIQEEFIPETSDSNTEVTESGVEDGHYHTYIINVNPANHVDETIYQIIKLLDKYGGAL